MEIYRSYTRYSWSVEKGAQYLPSQSPYFRCVNLSIVVSPTPPYPTNPGIIWNKRHNAAETHKTWQRQGLLYLWSRKRSKIKCVNAWRSTESAAWTFMVSIVPGTSTADTTPSSRSLSYPTHSMMTSPRITKNHPCTLTRTPHKHPTRSHKRHSLRGQQTQRTMTTASITMRSQSPLSKSSSATRLASNGTRKNPASYELGLRSSPRFRLEPAWNTSK